MVHAAICRRSEGSVLSIARCCPRPMENKASIADDLQDSALLFIQPNQAGIGTGVSTSQQIAAKCRKRHCIKHNGLRFYTWAVDLFGFPTWARTRGLRINRRNRISPAVINQCLASPATLIESAAKPYQLQMEL